MYRDGLVYRDSRMAEEREFLEDLFPAVLDDRKRKWKGGPVLFADRELVYTDPGENHSLIIGDTGSTKTLRFVLPLIYSCGRAGESMVIIDPKGELSKRTVRFLHSSGYKTPVINLRNPKTSSARWNPMGRIQKSYRCGGEGKEKAVMQMNDLMNVLFYSRSAAEKDKYWNETSGEFALGITGLMAALGEKLTIGNLLKWRYEKLQDGTLEAYFHALPKDSDIYQNLSGVMSLTAENTKSCILSTFDQLMRIFKATPSLTELLSESTFDIDAIGKEKIAIFLIVPDEKTTCHFLATLFIQQCYESLIEQAEKYGGSLPVRVNFVLEEFCNMPVLPELIPMLTAARSRNIRFHMVIQSYEQMIEKYGEHGGKTVLDNCGNLIYLHSRELSFLTYISQLAGANEYGRPLLSVSRLQRIKKNETIIFHDRCYPFLVKDLPLIFEYPVDC